MRRHMRPGCKALHARGAHNQAKHKKGIQRQDGLFRYIQKDLLC